MRNAVANYLGCVARAVLWAGPKLRWRAAILRRAAPGRLAARIPAAVPGAPCWQHVASAPMSLSCALPSVSLRKPRQWS